ncbi:pilin [Acinetobacter sp. SM34]|nr:pilin [Acinetobacter sp. SM34]
MGTFVADKNRWPKASDDVGVAAALLQGKYFTTGGVVITGGDASTITTPTTPSVIQVTFNNGTNNGKVMTLTPSIVAATGQISKWTCAPGTSNGILAKRLPTSCQ